MPESLRPGDIVFATMIDPQGRNEKSRTALIVEQNEGSYTVIAITSKFNPDVLKPSQVNLPWSTGNPRCHTGLTMPSRADVDWFEQQDLQNSKKHGFVNPILFLRIKKLFIDRLNDR